MKGKSFCSEKDAILLWRLRARVVRPCHDLGAVRRLLFIEREACSSTWSLVSVIGKEFRSHTYDMTGNPVDRRSHQQLQTNAWQARRLVGVGRQLLFIVRETIFTLLAKNTV